MSTLIPSNLDTLKFMHLIKKGSLSFFDLDNKWREIILDESGQPNVRKQTNKKK